MPHRSPWQHVVSHLFGNPLALTITWVVPWQSLPPLPPIEGAYHLHFPWWPTMIHPYQPRSTKINKDKCKTTKIKQIQPQYTYTHHDQPISININKQKKHWSTKSIQYQPNLNKYQPRSINTNQYHPRLSKINQDQPR